MVPTLQKLATPRKRQITELIRPNGRLNYCAWGAESGFFIRLLSGWMVQDQEMFGVPLPSKPRKF